MGAEHVGQLTEKRLESGIGEEKGVSEPDPVFPEKNILKYDGRRDHRFLERHEPHHNAQADDDAPKVEAFLHRLENERRMIWMMMMMLLLLRLLLPQASTLVKSCHSPCFSCFRVVLDVPLLSVLFPMVRLVVPILDKLDKLIMSSRYRLNTTKVPDSRENKMYKRSKLIDNRIIKNSLF